MPFSPRILAQVASRISGALDRILRPEPAAAVPGGCINETFRWSSDQGPLFIKIAPAQTLATLEAEAAGLEELSGARAVRVPRVLSVGAVAAGEGEVTVADGAAYLVLEWIDLSAASRAVEARLGEELARLHRITAPEFGWHRDNTIGSTTQVNTRSQDWISFFREHRLRSQLRLAACNGYDGTLQSRGERLCESLDGMFSGYEPVPSLLHGDLWHGNWAADARGGPVVFDPAVYYGDRETDIAMTQLFGGFGPSFYRAYQASWPLDHGAAARAPLYKLYHVLNHLNLFGDGYLSQAVSMIDRLLSELKR